MDNSKMNDYERYLVLASYEPVLSGGYEGFVNLREVVSVLEGISQKQNTSYLYNGELINFNIKQSDIESIYNSWNECEYRKSFDYIKFISNKLDFKII